MLISCSPFVKCIPQYLVFRGLIPHLGCQQGKGIHWLGGWHGSDDDQTRLFRPRRRLRDGVDDRQLSEPGPGDTESDGSVA
jgi:hypothetical protein